MKIISTQEIDCKDCHRCLRSCPVKAIGIKKGRARVIEDKCILCGKCVTDCPQQAKQVVSQLAMIKSAIASNRKVVISLAPSFASAFPEYTHRELAAAIQSLGISQVEETAAGAGIVSAFYQTLFDTSPQTVISSCCPVIVDVLKKYYPSLVRYIAPIISPMLVHAKMLRHSLGEDIFIVFAGPCIGKIAEASQEHSQVNAVITFEQLREWLKDSQGSHASINFTAADYGDARYFSIAGGILKSFRPYNVTGNEIIAVDGIERCIEVFESLSRGEINVQFIEALACVGGCVGGAVSGNVQCIPAKRAKVIDFIHTIEKQHSTPRSVDGLDFSYRHQATPISSSYPGEAEIKRILQQTSKFSPADEKNCGACGYNTCRDKAIAVYQGLAETTMCVPYMRSKAESFAGIIVENSLNGILAVNGEMIIQELNPVIRRMFGEGIDRGSNLTDYINCEDFIAAGKLGYKFVGKRVEYPLYHLVTEQMIVPVPDHNLIIGIISDVTVQEKRDKDWLQMKEETVKQATEIINKQMSVAQQIAGLLGETTADTKSALLELMWLLKSKEEQ